MNEKFEFTQEEKRISPNVVVRRIRALRDIPLYGVKAGDEGGFLQFAENLSPHNESWIAEEAVIYGLYSRIQGNALISGEAVIGLNSIIGSGVRINEKAKVEGTHMVGKDIYITGEVLIESSVIEGGNVVISGKAQLFNAKTTALSRDIFIGHHARVVGHVKSVEISGQGITVRDEALVEDIEGISGKRITIQDNAVVKLNAVLSGSNVLIRDAATLEGEIDVCENVTLKECVHLYNLDSNVKKVPCIAHLELGGDGIKSIQELKAVN